MVMYCVAFGCKNGHVKGKEIPFHSFPFKRPKLLELWIEAIKRKNWKPSKSSRICGAHFLSTDYLQKPGSTQKLLKPDAIPSVFAFPSHLLKKVSQPRRRIMKQEAPPSTSIKEEISIDLPACSSQQMMDIDLPSTPRQEMMDTDQGTSSQQNNIDFSTQTPSYFDRTYSMKRKVKTLRQKIRRRDTKISSMKDAIQKIKSSGHSNDSLNAVLENYFEELPLELVLLQKNKSEGTAGGRPRYSPLMKQFAHTLYFYSPKAYQFLKKYFTLPNGRTIRRWLANVDCNPGVLKEVLEFLRVQVKSQASLKNCSLIVDAMSIRKQTTWDHTRGVYTGNIDYGGIVEVDHEMAASEALFFQIVSYTGHFKCPVAYFLINKVDANLQAQLINATIRSLYEIGITVRSVTADGAPTNIASFEALGCKLSTECFFKHPCASSVNVYCMLDACHMLKLARNALAVNNFESSAGRVSWSYIQALDSLQEKEQLMLANSLTSQHVNFRNKVMNVRLAAQTLSSGVADAIEYLDKCGHDSFKNSSGTVTFIRKIDKLFDMLNCRNPHGRGFKAPIRQSSLHYYEEIFSETIDYLREMSVGGVPLTNHNRKTFAIGFILTMRSTLGLAKDLLNLEDGSVEYFLSYRCSQDNLEIFFSCIRSRGGWNNNPNTQQLKWALRQLLLKNSVTASPNGNCIYFENLCTPAFEFRSQNRKLSDTFNGETQDSDIEKYISCLERENLSNIQENVIFYISGYIVRKLMRSTTCQNCSDIMLYKHCGVDHSYNAPSETFSKFTSFVTRGELVYASKVVFEIVKFCEKQFRVFLMKDNIFTCKMNIKNLIVNSALHYFSSKIFLFVPHHPPLFDEDCHELQLVRKVIEVFLKCRMHHHSRLINLKTHGSAATIRQKMNKIILFKNC